MADWSQLPTELLKSIANRLNSDFYLLRFRSVCSTWRSSTPFPNPNHHLNLPHFLPSINDPENKPTTLSLSKRTLFLIFPPPQNHHRRPWLIKIDNSNNQLLYPLSHDKPLHYSFPRVLDFNDLSVVELGHEISSFNHLSNRFSKVVLCQIEHRSVLLTLQNFGQLAVFRFGDDRWTTISESYSDVCVFKGKPIVVNRFSEAFRVRVGVGIEPELKLDLVARAIIGGLEKYLVESNGELLLVVKYLSRSMMFVLYRLDEKEKRWVNLTSLGDRTLFLGDDCTFSLSGYDLGSVYRNCVISSDRPNYNIDYIHAFDFDLRSLILYYDYSKLFRPPEWISSR